MPRDLGTPAPPEVNTLDAPPTASPSRACPGSLCVVGPWEPTASGTTVPGRTSGLWHKPRKWTHGTREGPSGGDAQGKQAEKPAPHTGPCVSGTGGRWEADGRGQGWCGAGLTCALFLCTPWSRAALSTHSQGPGTQGRCGAPPAGHSRHVGARNQPHKTNHCSARPTPHETATSSPQKPALRPSGRAPQCVAVARLRAHLQLPRAPTARLRAECRAVGISQPPQPRQGDPPCVSASRGQT